jgi:hypothetical protein
MLLFNQRYLQQIAIAFNVLISICAKLLFEAINMKRIIFIIIATVFYQSTIAAATDTLICDYSTYCDPDGLHQVNKEFKLTFVMDEKNNVAYLVGNNGSSKVSFLPSTEGGMSFLEVTDAKNLMTTTVDSAGNSVHSRNTLIEGRIVPSQFYGKCILK